MNRYDPNIHHRKSIRLYGYDYAQAGLYFITIVCKNRECLFGEIVGAIGAKNLSPSSNTNNHLLNENPSNNDEMKNGSPQNADRAKNFSPLRQTPFKTVGSIIRGYKIGVTKWMRQNADIYDVWQRNYWDHIIRDEQSYFTIADYIINNPAKWSEDKFYTQS